MSYTLRGRIQSRLAAALPPLLLALGLQRWWAIELVALMLAVGLVLDAGVYHRALPYQPAWFAVPTGALELAILYPAMRYLGIAAPLHDALLLYGVGWLSAQVFAHAIFPRLRLEYGESGGEPGRAGIVAAAAVAITVIGGLGAAYSVRPPTIVCAWRITSGPTTVPCRWIVGGRTEYAAPRPPITVIATAVA
ncbi:MAG TPA: hypothetical protein VIL92_04305, partial [Gaiellaceae bacterium]